MLDNNVIRYYAEPLRKNINERNNNKGREFNEIL